MTKRLSDCSVAVVGLGLMGASLCMDLVQGKLCRDVRGVARRTDTVLEAFFAGAVDLAHRALQVARPAGVLLAEGAVLVRLLALGHAVLFPQQLQRHRGLLQLLVDLSPVGLEMARAARRRRRVHPCLQRLVIQLAGLLPRQAGGTRVTISLLLTQRYVSI